MIIYDTESTARRIMLVCSHVRGLMPDENQLQTATAFTFLRRIDCMIEQYAKESLSFYVDNKERLSDERLDAKLREISGGYPFYNYSGYTFEGILLSNNSIDVVMNSYLQGFSKNILEILDGMNFRQNLAFLQRKSMYLVELLQCFVEMNLSSSVMDNEEFVKLMTLIVSAGNKENYTSIHLSKLICGCIFSENLRNDENEITSIYDPVCGTGSMLALAGEKAKSIAIHQTNIVLSGQEISIFPSAVAKALVLLTGNDESKVLHGNTLTEDLFPSNRFHYILADFPLGIQWRPIKERIEKESLDANGRFSIGLPSLSDSQFLFIEHIISKMDTRGCRAAFITSSSVLWGGTASSGESRIRRWLFENDLVETIIALPVGTLTGLSFPVYLWIISNKKKDVLKGKVRLINTSINNPNKGRFILSKDFVKSVVAEYKSNILSMMSQIVKNEEFGYYEVDLHENGKRKERIIISLDTDINEFVAKERQPYSKGEITIDYSSVEKGYSVQFEKFFKQEQIDIISMVDAKKDLVFAIDAIASIKTDIVRIIGRSDSKLWAEYPLRAAIEVCYGVNRPPIPSSKGLPLVSLANLRKSSGNELLYEVTPKTKFSTAKDVIIVVKGANSGEAFRGVNGILTPSVASIKCTDENIIVPQYLYYLLKGYEKELMSKVKGISIKSLDSKSILDLKCMIPPNGEQLELVSYLDNIVGKIDNIIKALDSTENVFSTFRQTLIENVVRGKVMIK